MLLLSPYGGTSQRNTESTRNPGRERQQGWQWSCSWVPVSLRPFTGVLSNRGFRCQPCSLPEQLTAEFPRSQHVFAETQTAVVTWIHGLGGVAGLRSPESMNESFDQVSRTSMFWCGRWGNAGYRMWKWSCHEI